MKKLNNSKIERQNILNNSIAINQAEKEFGRNGILFNGVLYFTNQQLADFFEVDIRTIERILETHREELESNGYENLTGKKLQIFRDQVNGFVTDINVGHKVRNLGVSSFRTLLNFAMFLPNSSVAKEVRNRVLDIAMNDLALKTGGTVKYINKRDKEYLSNAFIEESERRKFTNAIRDYVEGNTFKYANLTNEIYKAVFKENASEYKRVLNLEKKDKVRETMYSEVLKVIASFEAGIAYEFEQAYLSKGDILTYYEAKKVISDYANHPGNKPHIDEARTKMASRDLGFRDSIHIKLNDYLQPISTEDFDKFLGEQSKSLDEQIKQHKDVFLRLKDK